MNLHIIIQHFFKAASLSLQCASLLKYLFRGNTTALTGELVWCHTALDFQRASDHLHITVIFQVIRNIKMVKQAHSDPDAIAPSRCALLYHCLRVSGEAGTGTNRQVPSGVLILVLEQFGTKHHHYRCRPSLPCHWVSFFA